MGLRRWLRNNGASATEAANRPGFTVPIDHEIGKGGAVCRVEQFRAGSQFEEHGGRRHPGRPIGGLSDCDVRSEGFGSIGGVDGFARSPPAPMMPGARVDVLLSLESFYRYGNIG
jgi:hypothetical protein